MFAHFFPPLAHEMTMNWSVKRADRAKFDAIKDDFYATHLNVFRFPGYTRVPEHELDGVLENALVLVKFNLYRHAFKNKNPPHEGYSAHVIDVIVFDEAGPKTPKRNKLIRQEGPAPFQKSPATSTSSKRR